MKPASKLILIHSINFTLLESTNNEYLVNIQSRTSPEPCTSYKTRFIRHARYFVEGIQLC